jgi:uncharacterized protein YkwD
MGRLRLAVAVLLLGSCLVLIQKAPPEPPVQKCPPPKTVRVKPKQGNEFEQEVIRLTNIERTSRGLRPLEVVPALMTDARAWSGVQASRGRMFHSKMGHGENVAVNYNTPQSVMTAWMNSPGHRRNILNPRYRYIGVGGVTGSGGRIYSTQCFE